MTGLSPNTMYLFRIGMMTGNGHGISLSAPAAVTTNPSSGGGGPTTGNPVPTITGYTVMPGFEPGSVMIVGYTPENPEHTLKYKKQSEPFAVPNAGEEVPADAWNLGGDIVSVQAGDHIGLYEVDMNGMIAKFADIVLTADHIPVAAPVIGNYSVEPGSTAGSTKITYAPEPGNSLKLVVSQFGNFSPTLPLVGGSFYDPAFDYTSGSDIAGVAEGWYLRLYEVDADGKIVRYLQLQLTAAQINGDGGGAGPIAGNASDGEVGMEPDNMIPVAEDTFEITLTNATVKDGISAGDLTVTGLPDFLGLNNVEKSADNKLIIRLMGAVMTPLVSDVTIHVVVKASAVNEAGMADSAPIALTLKKAE